MSSTTSNIGAPTPGAADSGKDVIVSDGLEALDNAISKSLTVTTTGGATSLSVSQQKAAAFLFTGVLGSAATITFLALPRLVLVANDCTGAFALNLKSGAGSTVTLAAAARKWLWIKDTSGNIELI